jgi:two-component system cell cycle response regulator DivK
MQVKILVVEDHPEHREYVMRIFTALGCRVIPASRAREAIGLARAEQPDLILMDIMLPEGDGRSAARELKSSPKTAHIPILAVTAAALPGDREQCLAAGCDDYLSKPFTPQQLRDRVAQVLQRPTAATS